MSSERDSEWQVVSARQSLDRPRGNGHSGGVYGLVAIFLAGLASLALWVGLIGYPMPRRRGPSRFEDLWSAYPGMPSTLDSYIFYAVAVSFVALAAVVVVTAVTETGPRVVLPWWVGGVQVITWSLVVIVLVVQWIRGADYANYTPPSANMGQYISGLSLALIVLAGLVAMRIWRARIVRREKRRLDSVEHSRLAYLERLRETERDNEKYGDGFKNRFDDNFDKLFDERSRERGSE
jgi:hypothetical protein